MGILRPRATTVERHLGYRFQDRDLLRLAFVHRSWANEQGRNENYERLEFLGDAVLGMVTAEWLYRQHPELPEGHLSKRKAVLVSRAALARHARRLGLGEELKLGVGEEKSGGRRKNSLLADAFEALLGAVFLDGGLEPARKLVMPLLERRDDEREHRRRLDAKTRLQELAQARGWDLPVYELVGEEGPDHDKTFHVECHVRGRLQGRATGGSKKEAEQIAAARALDAMEVREPGEGGC